MKSNTLKTGIITGLLVFLFTLNTNSQSSERQERGKNHQLLKY